MEDLEDTRKIWRTNDGARFGPRPMMMGPGFGPRPVMMGPYYGGYRYRRYGYDARCCNIF